jgi:hypothetical protein
MRPAASLPISCQAAIVGVGKSAFARDTGKTAIGLVADALRAALDDCGLPPSAIDGLYVNGGGDFDRMAEQLGLDVGSANQFWLHGRMCVPTLQSAALSVAAGLARCVACVYAIDISGAAAMGAVARTAGKSSAKAAGRTARWRITV